MIETRDSSASELQVGPSSILPSRMNTEIRVTRTENIKGIDSSSTFATLIETGIFGTRKVLGYPPPKPLPRGQLGVPIGHSTDSDAIAIRQFPCSIDPLRSLSTQVVQLAERKSVAERVVENLTAFLATRHRPWWLCINKTLACLLPPSASPLESKLGIFKQILPGRPGIPRLMYVTSSDRDRKHNLNSHFPNQEEIMPQFENYP